MDGGLRALFRQHLPEVDWQSIETPMTGGGVPDSNYCVDGFSGWIEHKKTDGWAVEVKIAQVGWIERRIRHGGRVLVAVRRKLPAGPRRGPAVDELYLFRGAAIRNLKDRGLMGVLDDHVIGSWHSGPQRWDWGAVLRGMKS